ncbi:dCMP deaminase [Baekduia alba]|uniref:deaminase n=1 Tax=Baekduia alba TaxID=2997333 RepID=UPI0023421A24|nr:deaminase [Baekduia alba]WCB93783.1 dCMP deaminase [Baekduia alba]
MREVVLAYVPVLHEGYRRFLERHGAGRRVFVLGRDLYADYRPLAKDVRALDPADAAAALASWGVAGSVAVLDELGAARLAEEAPALILPAEDVSYRVVERWFPRAAVRYDPVFLRWDKTKTVQMLDPRPERVVSEDEVFAELAGAAEDAAARSIDWWRQVGAALRFADGTVRAATNEHHPHALAPYAAGDPRSNFTQGVELELSTATHAEAALIARAAREGHATAGGEIYVTDFPCPPCAKLIANAGIARVYYRRGYAVLDGRDVLEAAGVEIVCVVSAQPV